MIEFPKDTVQIHALLRRPDFGGPLRFVNAESQGWRATLSMNPDEVERLADRLAALWPNFPRRIIQGPDRARLRKVTYLEKGSVLRTYARGITVLKDEVKADPAKLEQMARKLGRLHSIVHNAGRGLNAALDTRLAIGALEWYMLRGVLVAVVNRLEAKDCSPQEANKLRNRFSKLLLNKDMLLASRDQTRTDRDTQKQALQDRISETDKRMLVENTLHALKLGRPVDQATMALAARYNRELKDKAALEAEVQARQDAASGKPGDRTGGRKLKR